MSPPVELVDSGAFEASHLRRDAAALSSGLAFCILFDTRDDRFTRPW